MRKATITERKRHRSLSREDLVECIVPEWLNRVWPEDTRFLPQITYKGYIKGCIRGVNRKTHEVLVDLGFGDVFWIDVNDEAPRIDRVNHDHR
jgi:hypothetical protein